MSLFIPLFLSLSCLVEGKRYPTVMGVVMFGIGQQPSDLLRPVNSLAPQARMRSQ